MRLWLQRVRLQTLLQSVLRMLWLLKQLEKEKKPRAEEAVRRSL